MKKLLLLAMLTIGYIAGAQEKIQSVEAQIGVRRTVSSEWKWKRIVPCKLLFILDKNDIITNDKDHSVYTTYETLEATENRGVWKARDKDGIECIVKIEYNYSNNILDIEYDKTCYRYFFNN
jgi:hypothetical protein